MSVRRQPVIALAVVAIALSALSGCSAVGNAVAQTKPVACKQLSDSLNKTNEGLNSSMSSFASDPAAAVKGMESADATFKGGLAKIQNADVKKAGQKAEKSLAAMVADLKAVASDPTGDTTQLQSDASEVQTDFLALGKVCSA